MTNTYIQNFINSKQQELKAPALQNAVAFQKEKETNIKPENPKGYIVQENMLQSAGSSVTSLAKTGVYFVDALNGKGTDYTVGRINDGARFLGSLGIAAALASTAKSPKAKMMEFVGFATWFASMSLWPKMLGTTINATKGVDINQEYVDSYGRRKGFFEDAQYITWDLYKDKDLQKLGDKLGVPKNIENRNDAIKEKAKQVATQGNTLMMLTAGIATPIATALMCNALENPVSKLIEGYQIRKAEKGLEKLSEAGLMSASEESLQQLSKIIGEGEIAQLDANRINQVRDLFKQFEGTGIGDGVSGELEKLAGRSVVEIDETVTKALYGSISLSDDAIKAVVGENQELIQAVKKALETVKLVLKSEEINSKGANLKRQVRIALAKPLASVDKLNQTARAKIYDAIDGQLHQELEKHSKTEVVVNELKNLFKSAHDFVARKNIVDQYAKATIANVADSQTANHWDKPVREIFKALGMDEKKIGSNPEYIEQHLRELAKPGNEKRFDAAVEKIAKISKEVVTKEHITARKLIKELKKIGQTSVAGDSSFLTAAKKEAIRQEITKIENKVMNTQSSFYKTLLILDKIKDPNTSREVLQELMHGAGIDFWSNKGEHLGIKNADEFKALADKLLAPIKNILGGDVALRSRINKFLERIKGDLYQIDGANRNFIGNATRNRSDWAVRLGKSFNGLIEDAAKAQGGKNTWLKRVLYIAIPLTGVSLLAISQFGKKNNYNPDVYLKKGSN